MKIRVCHTILFGVCYFLFTPAFTQPLQKIIFKDLNIKNKSLTNVRKIHKDKLGFIWIATQSGVIRTDGTNYINYDNEAISKYKLSAVDIWDIYEDEKLSCIYTLSSSGIIDVINIYSGNVIGRLSVGLFSQDNWFMSISKFGDEFWIAGYQGVFILNEKTKKVTKPDFVKKGIQNQFCRKALQLADGNILIHIGGLGLFVVNPYTKQVLATVENNKLSDNLSTLFVVNDMIIIDSGRVLLATSEGLRIIYHNASRITKVDKAPCNTKQLNTVPIAALENTDNNLLISSNSLFAFNANTKIAQELISYDIQSNKKKEANNVNELFFDFKEKILWVGTSTQVEYSKLQNTFIQAYNSININTALEKVFYVHPKNNKVYINTSKGLISKDNNDNYSHIDASSQSNYQFTVSDNIDIVSFNSGLKVLQGDKTFKIQTFFKEFKGYESTVLNSSLQLPNSKWILGTEDFKGILLWDKNKHVITKIDKTTPGSLLLSNVVNNVFRVDNKIFILSDKSIAVLDEQLHLLKHVSFTKNNTIDSIATYFGICKQGKFYYITAYGTGVMKVDENFKLQAIISAKTGLSDNGVYNIFSIGDTCLYVTTNNGISVINTIRSTIKNLYTEDGLHSNIFEEAATQYVNGKIFAGGPNGFSIINTALLEINKKAPVLNIFKMIISRHDNNLDTFNLDLKKIYIPNDIIQTNIYFSGINWSNIEHTTFQWRIKERSNDWSSIGTQNFIPLIGLEHGIYHLQVKAANEDGVWSEPKELILVFLPKWYQTWWFYLLIVVTIAAILYALYRYRIDQIKKQHEIRKNIATDLHDDLGSTLNSVKVFTNLAISGVKQEESLQQVKDNLTEATMSLRDMIWVLDDSLDTVDELVTRLKQFAIPVTAASSMEFLITAGSDVNSRTLTKEEKRNLFLICKEAINNSIKYSGATQITADIIPDGKKIHISIADNGKGFDEVTVKKGYGLKNMQYRAGQIKYKVELASSPGKGTQIEIKPA